MARLMLGSRANLVSAAPAKSQAVLVKDKIVNRIIIFNAESRSRRPSTSTKPEKSAARTAYAFGLTREKKHTADEGWLAMLMSGFR